LATPFQTSNGTTCIIGLLMPDTPHLTRATTVVAPHPSTAVSAFCLPQASAWALKRLAHGSKQYDSIGQV